VHSPLISVSLVFIAALSWSTAGLFPAVVTIGIPTTLLRRSLTGGAGILCATTCHPVVQPVRQRPSA